MSEKNHADLEYEDATPKGIVGLSFFTFFLILMAASLFALPFAGETSQGQKILEEANAYLQVVGNLHPLILHLPIGIVVAVLTMEVLGWLSFGRWKPATNAILFIGVMSAIFANVTGFLSMEFGGRVGEEWTQHMWAGIAFAGILTLAYVVKLWAGRSGSRNPGYAILLFIAVGVMSFGAHIGGQEIHGNPLAPLKAKSKKLSGLAGANSQVAAKKPQERLAYEEVIVPILESKCYDCHSADTKKKGGLLLDSIAAMEEGGESDPAMVPGSIEKSYMMELIHLPADDEDRMPPPKKPQLDDSEVKLLEWWIMANAPSGKTLGELDAPAEIIAAVESLVSPAEREAMENAEKAAAEKVAAQQAAERAQIEENLVELKNDADLKNAVNYLSQDSSLLEVTTVSLRDKFTDAHAEKLLPVAANIQSLNLAATKITDAGLEKLAPVLSQLKSINLSETEITDHGLEALSTVKSLETINLHSTVVTNAGVQKLAELPHLKKLYLWNNGANQEVEKTLKEKNPGLEIDFGITAEQIAAETEKAAAEKAEAEKAAAEKAAAEKAAAEKAAAEKAAAEKAAAEKAAAEKAEVEKAAAEKAAAEKAAAEKAEVEKAEQ